MKIGAQRLREKLETGIPVLGMMINFDSLWFVDLLCLAGVDFIVLDGEHGTLNPAQYEAMLRVAQSGGMSVLARTPNAGHEIQRFLDMGAEGVFAAHVESREDALRACSAMRFPPMGSRGLTTITRVANYGVDVSTAEFVASSNEQLICGAMVETAKGAESIDSIVTSPGIDAILIGSGDLAASMGLPGDRKHPEVYAASRKIADRAQAHGKWVAQAASTPEDAQQAFAHGAQMVICSPASFIVGSCRNFVELAKCSPKHPA